MKKRTLFASLISTVAIALCFIFSSTGAWFSHNIVLEDSLDGETEGAYFAYGDGSESSPYGITNARHLYNLAWLQYLGRFNKDNNNDGKLDTVYFELGDDIDMEGYTALPPIGTTKYPFIGNFTGLTAHNTIDSSKNGKCHTISNLTVTNDYSQYTYHATTAQESDFGTSSTSVTQIVGFFGVVGPYNGSPSDATYDSSANSITNVGLEGLTVQTVASSTLIGLVAGYVNGTISGVPVNNSYIDIANKSASYIDTRMTDNLSDYSLIGYAADDDYLRVLQSSETTTEIPEVSNPLLSQGGDEWGGSIDMETMYNNLSTKLTNAKSSSLSGSYTYYQKEERTGTLDSNGNLTNLSSYQPISSASLAEPYSYSSSYWYSNTHYFYKDTGTDSQGTSVDTASYTLVEDTGYVGMSGRHTLETYEYTKDSITHVSGTAYYILNTSTGVYLSASSSSVISESSKDSAQAWILSSDGYIFTYIGDTRYYLSASGSNLTIQNYANTQWEWDDTNKTYKTGSYYLYYDNNSSIWALTSSLQTTSTYYTISSNGNYLLANGTSGINQSGTTSESSATHWYFENGSYGYLYTLVNDIKYYVTVSSNWGNISISLSTSSSSSCIARNTSSTNFLSCTVRGMFSSRTYYLYYYSDDWDGSYWTAGTNNNSVTITSKTETIDNSITKSEIEKWDITGTTSETRSLTSYPTYYPLTWADDTLTNPSEKNTGYVIAGDHYDGSGNDGDTMGDIRLSEHYKTYYLSNSGQSSSSSNYSYSKEKLFSYTYDARTGSNYGSLIKIKDPVNETTYQSTSGYTSYSDLGLSKYYYNLAGKASGSRISLDSMLSDKTAYGLHFMNADIKNDDEHKITIPYAMVNGIEHYNYELPEDAIDFNLKTGGLINFFAHTGYVNGNSGSRPYTDVKWSNSNNCFFSLHWIERDGEKIVNIKQIAKIYMNTEYDNDNSQPRYVYTYRDSSDNEVTSNYDTGVKDSNGVIIKGKKGDEVFDTYWLTDPEKDKFETYAVYYFEVPVNKGEYALGSCSGNTDTTRGWRQAYNKNGAYLMYLDIGASLKNTNAITIDEHWETKDSFYEYPLGTDFKDIESLNDTFSSVQGGESAAIIVSTSSKGEKIQFTYTESTSVTTTKSSLVVGPDSGWSYTASYKTINTSATIRGSPSTEIEAVPIESHTTAYDRETLYDMTSGKEGTDGTTYDTSSTTTITTHVGESDETTVKSDAITGTITLTTDEISQIVNVSFEDEETDRTLFTVEYCGTIGSKDTPLEIELSYNSVTHTYTLNFVTSETSPSNAIIRFTALNTTFTPTVDGKESTPINYNVVVQNNGVDNNQIGQVTEDTFYTIVPNQKTSS